MINYIYLSSGICFYELLTSQFLYSDDQTQVAMKKLTTEDIPPIRTKLPNIDPKLERIVDKALQKDRELRYQNAGEMCSDLEHYMYDGGYGPTNQVLEKYLKELFPEKIRF